MTEDVKPRRAYRSTRRAERVAQTRRDIIATAGALFRERGYAGVAMPVIATESGVAVETIYRAFGSKAGLFRAVIEAAVAGGTARAEVPVENRPAIRAIIEEPDPRRQVELYAATQPGIHRRSGPLLRVLAGGAAADPELAGLWAEIEAIRLTGQGRFVGLLAERGVLRPGLSLDDARDGLWALTSLAVYDMLVETRGWPAERYQAWLTEALEHLLLPAEPDVVR
ncbi:MAG TPA: helix-turn-helix domain-containing protein [Candidatus Limnocylindrales bacterium]|nr:helix-turn-helix domain-containing protein [Candidatus Limnocylindrales bacterium]